jgi:asparagine synthase (glutamine-hydrolysing)
MCGIYGSTKYYSDEIVNKKIQSMRHRGPDFQNFKRINNKKLTFGHARLSIIDLDPRSNQPFNYGEYITVVYNGEIYNFKELKVDLVKKGYEFNTTSDTEVLCALYLEYGNKCVNHLVGMFAFVIYDLRKQILFGARDRMGKKPFYYYHKGKYFEFSSQLSPIALGQTELTISDKAINYYLAWNSIPEPYSIYKEICKLKPGHFFEFEMGTGQIAIERYWEVTSYNSDEFNGDYQSSMLDLNGILKKAVNQRMIADVPLGVFLSGGVDSSLIASLAQKNSMDKVKSFNIKFNEKGFDESVYADQVAKHLGTDHTIIECGYNEGIELIKNFSHFYDEPFADSSAIPTMLLAKHTRMHVTVALSGDGGDESFMGYHRYNWINRTKNIYKTPHFIRLICGDLAQFVPNYRLKVIGKALKLKNINEAYISTLTNVDHQYIGHEYDFKDLDEVHSFRQSKKELLERVSDLDLTTYINWDINTKVDRATMAFSLESRAPLMDHRVIEFAQQLPTEYKYGPNGNQKRILKDILYQYVPKEIFDRPKAGFTIPFKEWFKKDLKEFVMDELSDENLKEIPGIDPVIVSKMIQQHMRGEWNRTPIIWKLLVLKQWLTNNDK